MQVVNGLLDTTIIRSSLAVGLTVLAAHTLEPVPEVVKNNLYDNLPLKFLILFLLCAVLHGSELTVSRAVICMLVALLLIVIFEYWRHIDKERAALAAQTTTSKESMWARDPYSRHHINYPGEPPHADVDMGIPPYPNQAAHERPALSKENMWGRDPYSRVAPTYPGEPPITDVDMGIPEADAKTLTTPFGSRNPV